MASLSKLAVFLLLSLACSFASSQAVPQKPMSIVIGFSPGGSIDGFARQLAPVLSQALGHFVIVENRPGANGVIAMDYVAKAAPDGQTTFLGASGNLSLNQLYYAKLPFNTERDFAPVTQVTTVTFLLMVHPSLPVKSVRDLVAYTKANPGAVNFPSSGIGSTPHLAGELFNSLAGVQATHVPYKGAGQAITDLIAGQVQFAIESLSVGIPHIKAGKLRLLATTTPRRLAMLPEVPTASESLPGLEVVNWYGLVVPAGTPGEVIARLRKGVLSALESSELRERMAADGMEGVGSTPQDFSAFMKAETKKWSKVIKDVGIRLE